MNEKMVFYFDTDAGREAESMWVTPLGASLYEIDNVPFYVQALACGDVVRGSARADGVLEFVEWVRSAGHSTIRVLVFDASRVRDVIAGYQALGCQGEISDITTLIAIDVPPTVCWRDVITELARMSSAGILDWEESAISENHRLDG